MSGAYAYELYWAQILPVMHYLWNSSHAALSEVRIEDDNPALPAVTIWLAKDGLMPVHVC